VFTGLVADLGSVAARDATPNGVRLRVRTALAGDLSDGDSVAVNGVCLTATAIADGHFSAEVMHETLSRSSLGKAEQGSDVNLELALRASDRLGGHIVQGHVDGVGTVLGRTPSEHWEVVEIALPGGLGRYLVEKGSITVDGVSLTVVEAGEASFTVSLIPETLARTTLGFRGPGDRVNLEADVIAKHVEKLLASGYLDKLAPAGEGS
jgi:riboflavin synthase